MRPVIIVFAKAPLPGRVKTRLIGALSPEAAAELHRRMVAQTLASMLSSTDFEVELHTDIESDAWPESTVPRRLQYEGDLGLKMLKALGDALDRGHPQAMIVGSDSPGLPASHLAHLLSLEADVALGPTEDGGYWGIAARRVHPAMFDSVGWSTPHARADTVRACESTGLSVTIGREWFDIDDPADLDRLDTLSQ